MVEAKETIDSARGWHKTSLLVTATVLLLLFSNLNVDYQAALNEAYTLRDLRMADYETFVRGFLGGNGMLPEGTNGIVDPERNITDFLNSKLAFSVWDGDFPNPTTGVTIIIQYEPPPINGTMQDWNDWINRTNPVNYFVPDWTTAKLSISRDATAPKSIVRYFSVRPSSWKRFPGEYTFRAYLDEHVLPNDRSDNILERNKRVNWWSQLETDESQDLLGKHGFDQQLRQGRFVVEGDVGKSQLREFDSRWCGVKEWLKQRKIWPQLSQADNAGEIFLPAIRSRWSELRDKPLQDAIVFMEQKQHEIQDVNLLGLAVPGRLCVVAIPLSYVVIFMFLLLDLRFLTRNQNRTNFDDLSATPWMALYRDRLAIWSAIFSIVVIPTALSIAILLKYHSRVDWYAITFSLISLVCGGFIESMVVHKLKLIRTKLP